MYADRHARSSGIDPRSLGIAVLLNGGAVALLLLVQPVMKIVRPDPPLHIIKVAVEPLPEPPPKPQERQQVHQPISATHPLVELPVPPTPVVTGEVRPIPAATDDAGSGVGPIVLPTATPTPVLVTVGPEIDPAHRGDLQPSYPAAELRAEREGVVTVRVLIGADGRVHQVEQVSATSDAFFRATEGQALRRWRFRPATRGSVPVEAWRTMTIRFVIPR